MLTASAGRPDPGDRVRRTQGTRRRERHCHAAALYIPSVIPHTKQTEWCCNGANVPRLDPHRGRAGPDPHQHHRDPRGPRSGPTLLVKRPQRFPVNRVFVALLYGRAGRLTTHNGGSRPGQSQAVPSPLARPGSATPCPRAAGRAAIPPRAAPLCAMRLKVTGPHFGSLDGKRRSFVRKENSKRIVWIIPNETKRPAEK